MDIAISEGALRCQKYQKSGIQLTSIRGAASAYPVHAVLLRILGCCISAGAYSVGPNIDPSLTAAPTRTRVLSRSTRAEAEPRPTLVKSPYPYNPNCTVCRSRSCSPSCNCSCSPGPTPYPSCLSEDSNQPSLCWVLRRGSGQGQESGLGSGQGSGHRDRGHDYGWGWEQEWGHKLASRGRLYRGPRPEEGRG